MFVVRSVRAGDVIRMRALYVASPLFLQRRRSCFSSRVDAQRIWLLTIAGGPLRDRTCHCGRLIANYTISVFCVRCRQCTRQLFGLDSVWLRHCDLTKDRQDRCRLDFGRSLGAYRPTRVRLVHRDTTVGPSTCWIPRGALLPLVMVHEGSKQRAVAR